MRKERPPYLSTTPRGEFYNLKAERVIPTVKAVLYWGRSYFPRLPFIEFSRIFMALLWTSLTHSSHASPTSSI